MKKHLLRTAACALILGALASCQSDDIVNPANMSQEQLAKELDKRFDFNSYYSLPLSLRFSPFENVYLYEVNPAENPDADPFFSAVTNISGQLDVNLPFPGHLIGHTVYAKGKTTTLKGTLTDKGITFVSTSRAIQIDNIASLCLALENVTDQYLRPGVNNTQRVADQMKGIDITPNSDTGAEVMVAMIDHGDVFENQIYYYYYKTNTELKGHFSTPQDFAAMFLTDKFRLFPLTSEHGSDVYETSGWNSSTNIGKTAQLKFYGEEYSDEEGSDIFPQGYSVGFVLVTKEYSNMWMKLTSGGAYLLKTDDVDQTGTWSERKYDKIDYYAAAMDIGDMLNDDSGLSLDTSLSGVYKDLNGYNNWVYTFEDNTSAGGDKDMNDAKFLAVIKGDIEEGAPKIGDKFLKFKGYYCFEDLYPDQQGGDYDLNDVVVRYEYNCSMGKVGSAAGTFVDAVICFDYTIEPIWDGATYVNDFHLAYDNPYKFLVGGEENGNRRQGHTEVYTDHRAQLQLKEQSKGEKGIFKGWANATFSGKFGVFDTTVSEGDEFAEALIFTEMESIIQREFKDGSKTKVIGINPYIYCQNTGEEVHLTKFPKSDAVEGSSLLDFYLTNVETGGEEYKYCPFAIAIPDCDATKFTPTPEAVPIYKAFPSFVEWVASNGKNATDWYATTPMDVE